MGCCVALYIRSVISRMFLSHTDIRHSYKVNTTIICNIKDEILYLKRIVSKYQSSTLNNFKYDMIDDRLSNFSIMFYLLLPVCR